MFPILFDLLVFTEWNFLRDFADWSGGVFPHCPRAPFPFCPHRRYAVFSGGIFSHWEGITGDRELVRARMTGLASLSM